MNTKSEKSELIRLAILHTLWERGDEVSELTFEDLQLPDELVDFFDRAVTWLERENLVYVGDRQDFKNAPTHFSDVQLSLNGENFLNQNLEGKPGALYSLLTEVMRDFAKEGISTGVNSAILAIWAAYITWKNP